MMLSRFERSRGFGTAVVFAAVVSVALVGQSGAAGAATATAPTVTLDPDLAVVPAAGPTVMFAAAATASPAASVQWQEATDRNGPWTTMPGATSPYLSVTATVANLGHAYRALFTNSVGSVATRPAKLVSKIDWMHDMGSDIADVPITELTIPGSHDSGTFDADGNGHTSTDHVASECESFYSMDSICQSYAKAQSRTIYEQLSDGIRYFDLRMCGSADPPANGPNPPDFISTSVHPVTCHELVSATLDKVLFQSATFASQHPDEVFIMDFNHHYEVNADMEATQIEQAFTRSDGTSMMVPPKYCTANRLDGTCAGDLTLRQIWAMPGHPNVIVNFENDGAPGATRCLDWACTHQYASQTPIPPSFFGWHPNLWGYASSTQTTNMEYCTVGAAVASCFGNTTDRFTALNRAKQNIDTRQTFAERADTNTRTFQHFFVQFLQTTPNGEYIRENLNGSLLDMAEDSNPAVLSHIFGCGDWQIYDCYAQYRPENLNIVADNFYDRTDDGGIHLDFVYEVIKLDEYARTSPVVTIAAGLQPAANGWYNAAILGGQGAKLPVTVTASDYYNYATGISAFSCTYGAAPVPVSASLPTTNPTATGMFSVGDDGVQPAACQASDGANLGFHGAGYMGAGPGSMPPVTYKIDTTPPTIVCPAGKLLLNQKVTSLSGGVVDTTSGPAAPMVSAPVSTAHLGSFSISLTGSDVAGNSVTATCPYTVAYQIGLDYPWKTPVTACATDPIKITLQNGQGMAIATRTSVTAGLVLNTSTHHTTQLTSTSFSLLSPGNYEYDLNTAGLAVGTYVLEFRVQGDPVLHIAPFTVQSSGGRQICFGA